MSAEVVKMDEGRQAVALNREAERFDLLQSQARMFATSPLVPEHLRKGTPTEALANCYIALTLAEAMGEVPLVVMQNIHIVKGKAGFAAQYMIARANASGIFSGRIDWIIDKSDPNNLSITAFATLKDTSQRVEVTCDMNMARAEQWTQNPKYKSMPEVMLRYRSAVFLVRFYAPDVMLGYRASEEIEDVSFATGPDLSATPLSAAMLTEQASGRVIDADHAEVAHDAETGEVIEDAPNDGTLAPDNPSAAEGPADDDRGEAHSDDETPAWHAKVESIRAGIAASKNKQHVKSFDDEFTLIRAGLPDEVIAELDALIAAKRRELSRVAEDVG